MSLIAILTAAVALIVALATRKEVMETVERLQQLVTQLNTTITTEAEQQKAVVADLKELANQQEDQRLLDIANQLEASIDRVKAIVPDEPAETEPAESGEPTPTES